MDRDWARLASRLARARKAAGLTQEAAWEALGVRRSTLQRMENPKTTYAKVQLVHRAAARLYGWTEDSIDRVLDGQDPILADGTSAAPISRASALDELTAGLSPRAVEALRGGSTLDTDVVSLSASDDPDGEVVLIAKSGTWEALSPERRRHFMKRWAELQLEARRIFSEGESSP
jgi:transcriptional regulator with XRE-family HTH domain